MWSYVQYRRIGQDVKKNLGSRFEEGKGGSCVNNQMLSKEEANLHKSASTPQTSTSPSQAIPTLGEHQVSSSKEHNETIANHRKPDQIYVKPEDDDDPLDPRNWPLQARCKNIFILACLIFVQAWAGAAESLASQKASREFHVSQVAENLSTALYLFGVGTGSLFAGPVSETVGRNPVYLVGTFCYLFFVLGTALTPNFGGQIACRYFVGLFASCTLATNGSSVRDQFRMVRRSFVFPIIAWANIAAPVIAPIAGGWIVTNSRLGWRWTEWMTLIISGIAFIVALLFLPETYLPLLLDWKAKQLRQATGDSRYVSEHAESASFLKRMKEILPLPAIFLAKEPVIAVLGGYLVLLYILLFSFLSGFEYIFKQTYMLSAGMTGSCFAAIAAGSTAFTLSAPGLHSWARRKQEHAQGSPIKPEFRLWPAIITSPLLPISLFWLGWSNYPSISIWSSLGACFAFGIVLTAMYVSSYEYIIDSYGEHAAIALASITLARYLIAGGMVMAARPMFKGIGVHWTMTLLGCIALVLMPAPLLFWKFGEKLRERSKYAEKTKR